MVAGFLGKKLALLQELKMPGAVNFEISGYGNALELEKNIWKAKL